MSERRRVGGDVYLTPLSPTSGSRHWRVDVGFVVPDWKAATEADAFHAAFPGTALLVDGDWYEIASAGDMPGAPHRTAYSLRPWDDADVIRTSFELTSEACDALTQAYRERQRRHSRGGVLRLLPFLTGLLPGDDQKRLEAEFAVPAVRATLISALPILGLSMLGIMIAVALTVGAQFGEHQALARKIKDLSPLALYFFIESAARLYSTLGNEPMGTLPVCLPIQVWRFLRGLIISREELDQRVAAKPPAEGLLAARDQVRALDHKDYDLEVVSRLPKDHWTANVTGIEYQGETYLLIDRQLLKTDDGPRHRFLLQKPRHEVLFKTFVRYHPEEVRDIYREQERAKTATWVETFPFLWGLTSPITQERLSRVYKYQPDTWSRWTATVGGILGVLLLVRGVGAMVGGFASAGTTVAFFAGIFLVWESALRWSRLRAGELAGSVLGVVFEPLAKRCLRWE